MRNLVGLVLMAGCLGGFASRATAAPAVTDTPPPNVVLIISDDQHWRDYAFLGHPHLRTPALDRLAIGRTTMQPAYDFMGRCRADKKPFLLWYAPMLPHDPHDPGKDLVEHYSTKTDSIHVAKYWGNVERFDRSVGELLDYLDQEELSQNTLVVYVTDNGWITDPAKGRFAPKSKLSPYDGGLRTPIMLRQPGAIEPRRSEALASSLDIMPTVLAACGVAAPAGRLWKLIVPATAGVGGPFPAQEGRLVDPESRARYERGEVELYDLTADPDETHNIAPSHPDIVGGLTQSLDAWWKPGR